jgi:hypothetical protein|tara:strand:+ start:4150 stop:4305 length:156 start_codon:yes stop_codon:yes gene_type:complete
MIAAMNGVWHTLHPSGTGMNGVFKVGFEPRNGNSAGVIGLDEARKQDLGGE